jgi:hypothetical protein
MSDFTTRSMGVLLKKGDGPYTRSELFEAWRAGIITAFNSMHQAAMSDPLISDTVRSEYLRCIDSGRDASIVAARFLEKNA